MAAIIPTFKGILSGTYFKNFSTKLGLDVLDKYFGYIMRQKKISQIGAQQLLVDCDKMEPFVHNISKLGLDSDSPLEPVPKAHITVVSAKLEHIRRTLKLLQVDEGILDKTFSLIWSDGKPADLALIKEIRHGRSNNVIDVGTKEVKQALNTVREGFSKVGEVTGAKAVTSTMKSTAKEAVGGIKDAGRALKNVMGDTFSALTSGNIFGDGKKDTKK